jgi:hypothetical protein
MKLLRTLIAALFAVVAGPAFGQATPPSDILDVQVLIPLAIVGFPLVITESLEGALLTLDLSLVLPSGIVLPPSTVAAYLSEPGTNRVSDAIAMLSPNILSFISDPPLSETGLLPTCVGGVVVGPVTVSPGVVFPGGPCITETGGSQDVTALLFGASPVPVRILVSSEVEVPEPATLLLLAGGLFGLGFWRRKIA